MKHLDVFRNLTSAESRIGVYTMETNDRIPVGPGCYAWFLPLWIYREELDKFVQIVGNILDYEQEPEKKVNVSFTWENVNLQARRNTKIKMETETPEKWAQALADVRVRKVLQKTLLEASLLMPPLYVGRTNNLKQRYLQHTHNYGSKKNTFHSRFTEFAETIELKIAVSELLFVCIESDKSDESGESRGILGNSDESDFNRLIEQLLMQFCRPPFSLK